MAAPGEHPHPDSLPTPTVEGHTAGSGDLGRHAVFTSGEIVAGRYEVRRCLGGGGFGQVYEAYDHELNQRVALKTLRRELAEDPRLVDRLRSEVRLARQVTHRNVCRIFDFCRHVLEEGAPVFFLSMEFLEGEPLSRLVSAGRLTRSERSAATRDIASGLAAVHRAGIVHRDVKAANVLLVDDRDGRGRRAVLCDFGLATVLRDHKPDVGSSGGTPAYMAPEQSNGVATVRSDIYSFAVLWHEILSGSRPERSSTEPRLDPGLDRRCRRVMKRCLHRAPEKRPQSMSSLLAQLSGPGSRWPYWRQVTVGLVFALLVAAVPTLGLLEPSNSPLLRTGDGVDRPTPRPSVVVVDFTGPSGEDSWLSTALPDMLTSQLIAGERLRVVPRAHVRTQCGAATSAMGEPSRFGCLHAARWVIEGGWSYASNPPGTDIRLTARVYDGEERRWLTELQQDGSVDDLTGLVTRAATRVRTALNAGEAAPAEIAALRGTHPESFEALRLYTRGRRALEDGRLIEAHEMLTKAIRLEPSFPLSRAALADVLAELGYRAQAAEAARAALALAGDLPHRERLLIEARVRELQGSLREAAEIYRSLWTVYPDEAEHGIRLARLEGEAGSADDGLAVIRQLRALPHVNGARLDLVAASLHGKLGDLEAQRRLAARAASEAEAQGFGFLVARAHLVEGYATWRLGDHSGAGALYDRALHLFSESGARGDRALALKGKADLLALNGDFEKAEAGYRQALSVVQEMGAKERQARILFNLASTLHGLHDYREANETQQRSVELFREVGRDDMAVTALTNCAWRLITLGQKLSEAEALARQAVALAEEIEAPPQALEAARYHLAFARLRAGAADETADLMSTSIEHLRRLNDPGRLARHLVLLARAEVELGRLSSARERLQESLQLSTGRDLREPRVAARVQLARIERLESRYDRAGHVLATALADARGDWHELMVEREWARLAQRTGDLPAAREHAERAMSLAEGSHPRQKALAHLDLASVHLAMGRTETARRLTAAAARLARDIDDVETVTALTQMRRSLSG